MTVQKDVSTRQSRSEERLETKISVVANYMLLPEGLYREDEFNARPSIISPSYRINVFTSWDFFNGYNEGEDILETDKYLIAAIITKETTFLSELEGVNEDEKDVLYDLLARSGYHNINFYTLDISQGDLEGNDYDDLRVFALNYVPVVPRMTTSISKNGSGYNLAIVPVLSRDH